MCAPSWKADNLRPKLPHIAQHQRNENVCVSVLHMHYTLHQIDRRAMNECSFVVV